MTENAKQNTWAVYLHQTPSGKRYIGITSKKPIEKRWGLKGQHYKNCTAFYRAIQKYGWENISHTILHKDLPYQEAIKMEKQYIKEYKTNNKKYGYNLTNGGEGVSGYTLPLEKRKEMSKRRQGENACAFGHYPSDETKKKMSEKGRLKVFSQSTREKMAKKKNKIVYQYSLDGELINIFNSATEASNVTGVNRGNICSCCRHIVKQAQGYFWSYQEIKDPIIIINHLNETKPLTPIYGRNTKPVFQLDYDGNILCEYPSIKEASQFTGIPEQSISAACKKPQSVTERYRWKYAD